MPDQPEPIRDDFVVVRFRPVEPAAALRKALQEPAAFGADHCGLSVFACAPLPGGLERTIKFLLEAADLPSGNPKVWFSSTAGPILRDGFEFWKDGYPEEEPEHYCVRLAEPDLDTVTTFMAHFSGVAVSSLEGGEEL